MARLQAPATRAVASFHTAASCGGQVPMAKTQRMLNIASVSRRSPLAPWFCRRTHDGPAALSAVAAIRRKPATVGGIASTTRMRKQVCPRSFPAGAHPACEHYQSGRSGDLGRRPRASNLYEASARSWTRRLGRYAKRSLSGERRMHTSKGSNIAWHMPGHYEARQCITEGGTPRASSHAVC